MNDQPISPISKEEEEFYDNIVIEIIKIFEDKNLSVYQGIAIIHALFVTLLTKEIKDWGFYEEHVELLKRNILEAWLDRQDNKYKNEK